MIQYKWNCKWRLDMGYLGKLGVLFLFNLPNQSQTVVALPWSHKSAKQIIVIASTWSDVSITFPSTQAGNRDNIKSSTDDSRQFPSIPSAICSLNILAWLAGHSIRKMTQQRSNTRFRLWYCNVGWFDSFENEVQSFELLDLMLLSLLIFKNLPLNHGIFHVFIKLTTHFKETVEVKYDLCKYLKSL